MTLKSKLDNRLWTEANSKLTTNCVGSVWRSTCGIHNLCYKLRTDKRVGMVRPLTSNILHCITVKNESYKL